MPEQASVPTASPEPLPVIGPVRPAERIETIDILRGWAIFGILVANMMVFAADYLPWAERWPGLADRTTVFLIQFFGESKFWTLFSFLFGLGFALQLERAQARGVRFFPVYRRRLLALLLIGILHGLIWEGDQLIIYALLGFLLFLFRGRSPRTLVIAAVGCLLLTLSIYSARDGIRELRKRDPETAQQAIRAAVQREMDRKAWREQAVQTYSQGDFGDVVAWNAQNIARWHSSPYAYLSFLRGEFPLLLLGLFAARRRFLHDIPANRTFMWRVFWWGLALGLVCTSVSLLAEHISNPALPFLTRQLRTLLWRIGSPALCFFYASAIVLLVQRERWKRRLAPLGAVGRMALTNYLLQTLIGVTIFYHYGLGFYGKVGPAAGIGLTLLIYGLQILLSVWWLRRFRFGPAEWLWRTLTYGKLQPMRVSP
jgi:uncharacterized protein